MHPVLHLVPLIPLYTSDTSTLSLHDALPIFLDRLGNFYQSILKWVLAHRKTTVFGVILLIVGSLALIPRIGAEFIPAAEDRKSTRLNSSHVAISYAVFCLKK